VLSNAAGVLTVDRAGLVNGAASISWFPIPQRITYFADTEQSPGVYKFFQRVYFGFGRVRGGLLFRTRFRRRGATTQSAWQTTYYPNTQTQGPLTSAMGLAENVEFEAMLMVPTAETQGTGVEVSIDIQQAATFAVLDALTLTYQPRSGTLGGRS
jgi:hypothetical protein